MRMVEKGQINIHNSIKIKTRWVFYQYSTPYTLEFYLLIAINSMITYLFLFFYQISLRQKILCVVCTYSIIILYIINLDSKYS